jgi:hypothetical protein
MKRSMCGIALLAAATALWSCNGDPTGSIRDSGQTVLADPTSLFMDQGANKFVTVELVDGQGNQLEVAFEPQNVGAGITVVRDTAFLQTSTGHIQTSERFIVTGTAPTSTSFQLVSGGKSVTIPVKVTPAGVSVTLSNPTPAANEGLVITLPAGYKFGAGSGATVVATPGITTGRAADSSSVTVLLPPLTTGLITADSVQVDFLPGVSLSLPTTETVTVGAATTLPGTAAPGTAPVIAAPAAGLASALFDLPDFAATIDHFYKIDVTEAGDYTITGDWSVGSDIDLFICVADATCAAPNFFAATANKPESGTVTLPVGTHYLGVEDFGGDAAGALVTITVER